MISPLIISILMTRKMARVMSAAILLRAPAANNGAGTVTVRHVLSEGDVYRVKGTGSDGTTFIVTGFDAANETFEIHMNDSDTGYNAEIVGRALVFEVWIVSVVEG